MANDQQHLVNIEKVEYHYHNHVDLSQLLSEINILKLLNHKIMGQLDDLKTEVAGLKQQAADLQTSLDNEQAQIQQLLDSNAQVVTDLNTKIADLEAQVAAGISPEQLQPIIDDLKATRDSIATSKTDLEGTVPDTPPTP